MSKSRLDYKYVARRIDPDDPQNLGDYLIYVSGEDHRSYHYASHDYPIREGKPRRRGRMINRSTLMPLDRGSRIYNDCLKAVERLHDEENVTAKREP